MKQISIVTTAVAIALGACAKKEESAKTGEQTGNVKAPAEAAPAPKGHPVWPDVDLAAELKRLEGKWKVKASFGQKEPDTWQLQGDKLTRTTAGGETKLAKVSMSMPGQLAVKEGDMSSYYAYARNGDDLWIGLGTGGVKVSDHYYVATDHGVVAFDGKTCAFHKKKMSFGGGPPEFEKPASVKCEVQKGGDKAVFHYQVPKFMKKDELEDKQIVIVGTALLNDQLRQDHKATKAQ